ncbi:MAG TPA: hypothetical protein VGB67_00565 [Fibrella sp.]|jgi:hypothetical protein
MIKKYRKKPIVIEAMHVLGGDRISDVRDFCPKLYANEGAASGMYIETLEGDMQVTAGDYIIKGIQGEFYPCKPDIFEATYEEVA